MDENFESAERAAAEIDNTPNCRLDIQHWYRRVYALCRSRLFSKADAEDATQETFVRGIAGIDELQTDAAVGGWLRKIARNVCVDTIRRNHTRRTSSVDLQAVSTTDKQDLTADRDQREHLMGLIDSLPQSHREIILLHYYESMTYDEMATWLNVARSTVNERLSKARHTLKVQLSTTENAL